MGKQRIFVLGLDGMPHSLLMDMFSSGKFKNLSNISSKGTIKRLKSVIPTISSVAWTSYATGTNPAEHNIFGFIDRTTEKFDITIPTSVDRKAETLWSKLSKRGQKVVVMNVPMTYPPEPVNGIMVSCFLCTDIEKSTYPKDFYKFLKERDYIIDVDAWLVRQSKYSFLEELLKALQKRFEIAFELMDKEDWDFFQLHIMETDRLMHFFWNVVAGVGDSEHSNMVDKFFDMLDSYIGQLYSKLDKDDTLMILSDHGFCAIKSEVQLNNWLESEGLLVFDENCKRQLMNYSKESVCYSLLPGRIYINLEGREEKGTVPIHRYEVIREEIKQKLMLLRNPSNGELVIDNVFFREEIYSGEYINNAPDIIANPRRGYDLKGALDTKDLFTNSILDGMHTYDDAMLIGINCDISEISSIEQVASAILEK